MNDCDIDQLSPYLTIGNYYYLINRNYFENAWSDFRADSLGIIGD